MNPSYQDSDSGGPGKIIALVVLLLVMLAYLGFLGVRGWLGDMAEKYTSTEPVDLPQTVASESEIQSVIARADAFVEEVKKNESLVELSLSARDINILINHHPEWSDIAGGLHVSIEGDQLHGRISQPISDSGETLNGRYLNGDALLRVTMEDGRPAVFVESLDLKGEQLPGFIMDRIRAINLLADNEWDPDSQKVMGRVKSVRIQDGRLLIGVGPEE